METTIESKKWKEINFLDIFIMFFFLVLYLITSEIMFILLWMFFYIKSTTKLIQNKK